MANASLDLLGGTNYLGDFSYNYQHTPLLELQRIVGSGAVKYAQGCDVTSNSTAGFAEAVAAAETSAVAVVFAGIDTSAG